MLYFIRFKREAVSAFASKKGFKLRLTHIKLAGFKSFVDPTSIAVPGQLVGVVGPNGCGKSNVIDAVRWVLGESSAKNLRGEKMEDVIFNGSSLRKPAGRAAVELVFDNSLQRVGGQWGQYAEISVKRALARDGTSDYFINGQHVRRRDIGDIFLGTGLGPRAYAIIEQGMISRVITSKPEELRAFLEEVAGVSKYRERRKETEARLEDSRENLSRVDDIRVELGKQIDKLTEQARVAAQYNAFQKELAITQNLLAFTRQREALASQQRYAAEIAKAETAFEGETARLREIEAELDSLRQEHYAETDQLSDAQAGLFEANTKVVQLEQEINYLGENRRRLTAQIAAIAMQLTDAEANREANATELERWHGELARGMDKMILAREQVEAAREQVPSFEAAMREAITAVRLSENQVREAEQGQALQEARESNALRVMSQLELRKNRLTQENMGIAVPEPHALGEVEEERAMVQEGILQNEEKLAEAEAATAEAENGRRQCQQQIGDATRELARIEASLLALQNQQARMDNNSKLAMWFAKHGLEKSPRLWQSLKIASGWEDALEAALGLKLNAIHARDAAHLHELVADAPPGSVSLYVGTSAGNHAPVAGGNLQSLGSIVTAADEAALPFVRDTLANVFMLDDESQAAQQMQTLPQGACLVTKTGHVYSSHGLVLHGPQSELHGVLQRQREIEALKEELPLKVEARHDVESRLKAFEQALSATQEDIRLTRAQIQDAKNKEHQLAMQALKLQQALEQAQGRRNAIREELKLLELDEERERTEMMEAQAALEEGGSRIADITDALMVLEDKQQEAERAVQEARERINGAERAAQEANYFERTCHDKIKNFTEQTASLATRVTALAGSETAMAGELANMQESDISERLQEALSLRETREDALKQARSAMDAATGRLRELDEAKSQIAHSLEPLRTRMTEIRMKEQEARLNEQALSEALAAAEANLEELAEMVEKKTRSSAYSSEITRLTQAIAELGAVNLAALQELEESSVRKEFLDAQSADLAEAINTLENAIKRIDRETRELLQNTFDAVNKNFTELFPALFGGGNAYLKLTGDEILDAGVQVFAQPPGKRNQSIQLLSGGEKALTALSLVFSLFRLNPAPFCLLDEVDAPLDDSNTDRFCAMVKKMSESTQFMFITHNKVTMEMAEQLVGVTMNEPGVSRVVAVDIEAARGFVGATAQAA